MDDEEECEMEDHDPAFPRVPSLRVPRADFGSFVICETCAKEVFGNVMRKETN